MKVNTTGKDFVAALNKAVSVITFTKAMNPKYAIVSKDNVAYVGVISLDATAFIRLGESEGEGYYRIDNESLAKALKAKKGLCITADRQLTFASTEGKFKLEVALKEFDSYDVRSTDTALATKGESSIHTDTMRALIGAAKRVALKNIYALEKPLSVGIDLTQNPMHVLCYDTCHVALAFADNPEPCGIKKVLSTKAFGLIDKFVGDKALDWAFRDGRCIVSSEEFCLSMPEMQSDDTVFSVPLAFFAKVKGTAPACKAVLTKSMRETVDSMLGIHEQGAKAQLTFNDGLCQLSLQTTQGHVTDEHSLEVEGHVDCLIDPDVMRDLFSKLVSECNTLRFINVEGASRVFVTTDKTPDCKFYLMGIYDEHQSNT